MTAHTADCDGWFYVGKGALPNAEDDSVPCTGQCIDREATHEMMDRIMDAVVEHDARVIHTPSALHDAIKKKLDYPNDLAHRVAKTSGTRTRRPPR